MKKTKTLSILLSLIICLSSLFAFGATPAFAAVTAPKVTATNTSCTSVKLSWNKITSAKSYVVYRSTKKTSGFKAIKTITKNTTVSYTNTGLSCGKTYYYKVTAVAGKTKKTSAVVAIKVAPAKIGTIAVSSPKCKQVKVSYSKISGATGYQIYTSTDNKTFKLAKTTTGTSYTVSVGAGKSLYFKVRAYKTVGKSKYYGAFSTVKKATSVHNYTNKTTAPTCTNKGYITYTCSVCKYSYKVDNSAPTGHNFTQTVVEKTETEHGYTINQCTKCDYSYNSDFVLFDGAELSTKYTDYEVKDGKLYGSCTCHNELCETDTLYLNISDLDEFELEGVAKFNPTSQKLTLYCNTITKFELSGDAKDMTVSVDAKQDGEVKLNNLSITNQVGEDCIRINNKSEKLDATGATITPTIDISAKDGTINSLSALVEGGKGIQCEPKLTLKGHGTLNINTVSSCITCDSKVYIRNLTLNLTSTGKRGIDTEYTVLNEEGLIVDEGYANMEIGANANVEINSADDGIRCKNLEFTAVDGEDVGSNVAITSGADAIQLEGKTGLTMASGNLTIKKGNYKNKKGGQTIIPPAVFTPAVFTK